MPGVPSLVERTVDACEQLQRYGGGVANEHLAEALEALVELNDDVHHGRARFCLMAQTIRLHRALSLLV